MKLLCVLLVCFLPVVLADCSLTSSGIIAGTASSSELVFFVTSITQTGNINSGNPDGFCQARAALATSSLESTIVSNAASFQAFIATSTLSIATKFASVATGYDIVNSEGDCLAPSLNQLFVATIAGDDISTTDSFDQTILNELGNLPTPGTIGAPVWTGSMANGAPITGGATTQQCNNWATSASVTGSQGVTNEYLSSGFGSEFSDTGSGADIAADDWLFTGNGAVSCSTAAYVYCLQASATVSGDPQFIGLQGQSFQVHGVPDEYFNLISTPSMQLNSRFVYLASGSCTYNNTACWTHPGTYVSELGWMFGGGLRVRLVAGSHAEGMRAFINNMPLSHSSTAHTHIVSDSTNSSNTVTVTHMHHDRAIIRSAEYTIDVTNSDMFFNFAMVFHNSAMLKTGSAKHHINNKQDKQTKYAHPGFVMHGLIGQTWMNARYPDGMMYEGSADDYMLGDSQLFSSRFAFNQFNL